jgi:glycosyltransferase involved in cell wall biosynthesis
MRILYDGNIYSLQKAGGINRYFANLISRLPLSVTPVLTTCRRQHIHYPAHPNLHLKFFYRPEIPRTRYISFWLGTQYLRAFTRQTGFDLLHPTYYSLLNYQALHDYSLPLVLTVHDFIQDKFDPHHPDVAAKRQAILAAQAILCVSHNTKQDLLEAYPHLESKITVTPLASEIDRAMSYGDQPVPAAPYCLYVGSRLSYKNFDGLLTAFAKVISVYPDLRLCVVGAPFDATEQQRIAALSLGDRICNYGYISDMHLAKLYRCSLAFVYPSFYEGFGIPPLEAMACGTAVVAANTSSLPEVVGEGGILFNPYATTDLADILLSLLDNPLERDRWVERGLERAKAFSWDQTAAQTFQVYQSMGTDDSI